MTTAPQDYTPEFCDQVRVGCASKMEKIEETVDKVDNRIWSILVIAVVNLLATVGGLVSIMATHALSGGVP